MSYPPKRTTERLAALLRNVRSLRACATRASRDAILAEGAFSTDGDREVRDRKLTDALRSLENATNLVTGIAWQLEDEILEIGGERLRSVLKD